MFEIKKKKSLVKHCTQVTKIDIIPLSAWEFAFIATVHTTSNALKNQHKQQLTVAGLRWALPAPPPLPSGPKFLLISWGFSENL